MPDDTAHPGVDVVIAEISGGSSGICLMSNSASGGCCSDCCTVADAGCTYHDPTCHRGIIGLDVVVGHLRTLVLIESCVDDKAVTTGVVGLTGSTYMTCLAASGAEGALTIVIDSSDDWSVYSVEATDLVVVCVGAGAWHSNIGSELSGLGHMHSMRTAFALVSAV